MLLIDGVKIPPLAFDELQLLVIGEFELIELKITDVVVPLAILALIYAELRVLRVVYDLRGFLIIQPLLVYDSLQLVILLDDGVQWQHYTQLIFAQIRFAQLRVFELTGFRFLSYAVLLEQAN